MADRDKIPSNVPRQYRDLYKQVCEQLSPEVIAESALRPLMKDLKTFGNPPLVLIGEIAKRLEPIAKLPMLRMVTNWTQEHQKIEELVEAMTGHLDGILLAKRAGQQVLHKLASGDQIQDTVSEMIGQYILSIYITQFRENFPYSEQHHRGIDQETVEQHLSDVLPYVSEAIEPLAEQLIKYSSVNSLHLPKQNKQPIDIHGGDITQGIIV